jgi:cyclopropane-fatty-acyl-phospholipid synthase
MLRLMSTEGQTNLPRYFTHVFDQVQTLQTGSVEFSLPDGRVFAAEGKRPGAVGRIDVGNPDLFTRVVREGDMGFSDAFLEGWWTSPDLQALLDVVFSNSNEIAYSFDAPLLPRMFEKLRNWLRRNSKRQARKNISYHYDLGNEFYSEWLDNTMTYSSGLFKTGQEDLEKAQIQKYASICDQMSAKAGDHILEIGCGWGGFAEYAAAQRGVRVTGLTISKEQHDFATDRIDRAGLSDKVEIVMRDYRNESGTYDGVASIEMFEAVGQKYWPVYFETIRDRLKPGAKATLQVITVADRLFDRYRTTPDFIQKHIFPGGMLPSPTALRAAIVRAGLDFQQSIEFGRSYSLTLRRWYRMFNEHWSAISQMGFDQRFKNMWNFYLTSCASGFEYGTTDVMQVTMCRPT